jgi:uncharacterized damage-inducible protein DinB
LRYNKITMNAIRIIERGHQNFLDIIKDLPEKDWTEGFATSSWTVKDIVSHLATYEALQAETFQKFLDVSAQTPLTDQKAKAPFLKFNEDISERDQQKTWQEVLTEYMGGYTKLRKIIGTISSETVVKPATLIWYNEPSSLDDVVALNFGHKKHHLAQIKLFRQKSGV